MTEDEWLSCTGQTPLLAVLRGRASERKVRLFAVACCRRVEHLLTDDRIRAAVEVAELWADRRIPNVQRVEARRSAKAAKRKHARDLSYASVWAADAAISTAAGCIHAYLRYVLRGVDRALASESTEAAEQEQGRRVRVLLDIFGYPLRPVPTNPAWRTPEVLSLAQAIYEERAFERLPILADALAEAGCDNPGILTHCRGAGPHVRACWCLDLVLGKE